jgi:membrane-bound lytic murein transglycosylase D
MALPIMESGYQNLPQSRFPQHAAGVWQFVPQTARNFGLRVDTTIDERLDVKKATDAACRYLGALFLRFQDWELSVLAYNAGENKVQEGIAKTHSRNAWTLIEQGFAGDEDYLAKIEAAILIRMHPSILE